MFFIKDFKIAYYLLEGMLDSGLDFIGTYLGQKIGYILKITDASGKIFYPDLSDQLYILPHPLDETNPGLNALSNQRFLNAFYHPAGQCLYYLIQHNASCLAYIIVENIPLDRTDQAVALLQQGELALKYHFTAIAKVKEDFGQSLWEHFFQSPTTNVPDRLKFFEQTMDNNCHYFVAIIELEEGAADVDWNRLRTFVYESMHISRTEYVSSIIVPGRLITIIKCDPPGEPMDADPDWAGREGLTEEKRSIEEKFHSALSIGLGRAYLPSGLLKSYQEAAIALALARITGKKQYIQSFSQLGVFTALFSNEAEVLKKYCLQVLGKVIQHDREHRTDYLSTMRMLLDNECSWTTTANQLYVHVNTVYYRMVKVENLLNIDFSQFETRLHLYTAIKVWDTLHLCGLLEE